MMMRPHIYSIVRDISTHDMHVQHDDTISQYKPSYNAYTCTGRHCLLVLADCAIAAHSKVYSVDDDTCLYAARELSVYILVCTNLSRCTSIVTAAVTTAIMVLFAFEIASDTCLLIITWCKLPQHLTSAKDV
jgi:hypothetical protein